MDPLVSGQAHHNKHKTKTPPTTIKPANFSHQPTFGVTSSSPSRSIAAESTQPSYRVSTDDPTPAAHNFEHRESTQSEHPASCSCTHCKNSVIKTVFAILIVAIILILGVIGGIYIDREIILKSKVNTEQTRVNDAAVDAFVESDLIAKVSYLSMANSEEQPAYTSSYRVSNYEGIFTRFLDNTFNDADRLGVAVHSLMDEYQPADNSPYENFPEYIPAARVKERFISIFGTEPNIVPSNYCPGYIYDSSTDVFYVTKKCGNAAANPDLAYKSGVSVDSDTATVRLRIGSVITKDTEEPGIYNDITASDTKTRIKTPEQFESDEAMNAFMIDENNYGDFTEYIVTFSKNSNGDYTLNNVSKA